LWVWSLSIYLMGEKMKTKIFFYLKQISIKTLKILGVVLLVSVLYAGYFVYPFLKENTVILRMSAGLGNQLFQYSAAYAFAKKTNSKFYISIPEYYANSTNKISTDRKFGLYKFGIKKEQIIFDSPANQFLFKILRIFRNKNFILVNEKNFFNFNSSKTKKIYFIRGYFEDTKYFENDEKEIKELFNVKHLVSARTVDLVKKLQQKNSVCIHVRLGDWVIYRGELHNNYYYEAVKIIKNKIKDPEFYVFSDEPKKAKKKFKDFKGFNYMNNKNLLPIDDFFLLANCTNNINSQSSFNWWSSFLNSNLEGVVVTVRFRGYHKNWIKLDDIKFSRDNYKNY